MKAVGVGVGVRLVGFGNANGQYTSLEISKIGARVLVEEVDFDDE